MTIIELLLRPLRTRRVTLAYPRAATLAPRGTRGTPVIDPERCRGDGECHTACPTAAITLTPAADLVEWRLDYGLCVFCGECVRACPSGAIATSDVFELAQTRRVDVVAVVVGRRQADV